MLKTNAFDHLFDEEQPSGVVANNFVDDLSSFAVWSFLVLFAVMPCLSSLATKRCKNVHRFAEEAGNSFLQSLQSMEKGFLLNWYRMSNTTFLKDEKKSSQYISLCKLRLQYTSSAESARSENIFLQSVSRVGFPELYRSGSGIHFSNTYF